MTREERLAAIEAERQANIAAEVERLNTQGPSDLEVQLTDLANTRDTENAQLLSQLQNQFTTTQQNAANTPIFNTALASFVDASTGSNFSRSAQALQNQRALLASGQDPVSLAFRQQLADERELQQGDNITVGQELNSQLQINRDQRSDAQAILKAQLDANDAASKAETDALDRELAAAKEAREASLNAAKINKLNKDADSNRIRANKPAVGKDGKAVGGGTAQPKRKSLFGFLGGVAEQQLPSFTGSQRTKTFTEPLNRIKKLASDEIELSSRARTALNLLNDPDPQKALRKVSISAIQAMLARASGEVGALTEADKQAFSGRTGLFDRIRRKIATGVTSDLTKEDIDGLRLLAETFVKGSNERIALQSRSSISAVKASLGVTDQELIDNGILGFIGIDGLDPAALGLGSAAPVRQSDDELNAEINAQLGRNVPAPQPTSAQLDEKSLNLLKQAGIE